ncbi:MAG: ATP-binding cassette domain-containing protein, partial [Pauljensenia sp.]
LAWVQSHYPVDTRPRDVDDLLATFGLSGHAQKSILTLSGGLRRRLDLAAAVVGRPELLILDEPTTGLDPSARRAVHDLVAEQVEAGSSLLLTTHDLAEADRLADRILILDRGRVVAQGSPDELRRSVEGQAEITWTSGSTRHLHVSTAPEDFLRELLTGADVSGLEIHRPTLEDAYLRLITPDTDGAHARPTTLHPVTTNEETGR